MAKRKVKKSIRKFLTIVLIILLIGALLIFGLVKKDSNGDSVLRSLINKVVNSSIKEEPTTTTTTTTTTKKVQIIDEDSDSRNIAVMINNISTVWGYQSGIQDAYIVYELIVEGNITRLMGIYKDATNTRIGTIRSARAYYLDYVLENDAIYLHIGGSPGALEDIPKLGINDLVEDSTMTYRVKNGLSSEHTAFASMIPAEVDTKDGKKKIAGILSKAEKKKYRLTTTQPQLLHYSADELDLSKMENAVPANEVLIPYSSKGESKRSFTYDSERKVYLRFQNGKPHKDAITKEQYYTKNIITYQVKNYDIKGDEKGRQELDNIGSGTGYYISNGYAVPITWEKKSRRDQTVYRYMDGKELVVNDGNTYIEIQPTSQQLTIS